MGFTDAKPAPAASTGGAPRIKYSVRQVGGMLKMRLTIPKVIMGTQLGGAEWLRVQFGSGENAGQILLSKSQSTKDHSHKVTKAAGIGNSLSVAVLAWTNFKPGTKGVLEVLTASDDGIVARLIDKTPKG